MAESLHCTVETDTTLYINYTSINEIKRTPLFTHTHVNILYSSLAINVMALNYLKQDMCISFYLYIYIKFTYIFVL